MTITEPPVTATAAAPADVAADLPAPSPDPESFAERVFAAVLGAQEVQAAYLGDRLGWYRALAEVGPLTSVELAERTGTAERYAREWLEHQAACAWVTVDDPAAAPTERRFALPDAHAEVLTDDDSLAFAAPFARFAGGLGLHLDTIAEAYRTGAGVSWAELGDDPREAQAAANRPLFLHELAREVLPSIPDVAARLDAGGRVADVGCGAGWSSIGIARQHPGVTVDGFDLDGPSVEMARRHAAEAGVADRVRFRQADAATVDGEPYDVVLALECIHDLGDPVGVLAAMGRLAGDDGVVVVMDERVGERFAGPADEVERLFYGFSLTCCLPDGLSHEGSVGTGTVMRPATLAGYAAEAGFAEVEVLDVDNDFFRFYRLHRRARDTR
jgi:SAM-dependent methyltransferase